MPPTIFLKENASTPRVAKLLKHWNLTSDRQQLDTRFKNSQKVLHATEHLLTNT